MSQFALIVGPCVIESHEWTLDVAKEIKNQLSELDVDLYFKASFDKANRSSISSFRGPGLEAGLETLAQVKKLGLNTVTDFHHPHQAKRVAEVVDVLQIPAFLCRQTDMIEAAVKEGFSRGCKVNIKKGQFLAPWDAKNILEKVRGIQEKSNLSGETWLTERGVSFGYNRLIVDMASFQEMQAFGAKVIYDATHSIQTPGSALGGTSTGGERKNLEVLARAAVASGADGVFMEVHTDPDQAKSDGPNAFYLSHLKNFVQQLLKIRECVYPMPKLLSESKGISP